MRFVILFLLLLSSFSSKANWDGVTAGVISSIQVTHGTNYGFRITLENNPALCNNDHTWAYLNKSDSNYETYVAVLLAAHLSQKKVSVYTNRKDGAADGYCHIGHIALNK